ncbi:MAG: serine hydrolase, partial [Candidatus Heimdallarchaeaceae archaeon]
MERIKWKELDQQIANLMQQAMIPGLSLTVIKDQDIIYSKGYGSRQMEKSLKVDTDTLFG